MPTYKIMPPDRPPYNVEQEAEPVGLPDGYSWTEMDTAAQAAEALLVAQMKAKEAIKALRQAKEFGGCDVAGVGRFQTDADSQRKVNGSVSMAMIVGAAFSVDWRLADDSIATLNAAQMIGAGVAIGQHVAACQYRKNELDALVEDATTVEAVEAINVAVGWP